MNEKEWRKFFKKVFPIIKEFHKNTKLFEGGDPETVKRYEEYKKKMDKKYLNK